MQNHFRKSTRPYITPFVCGVLAKEVVTFVREGGLSDDFPLARCLFVIMICSSALIWLWGNDETAALKEKVQDLSNEIKRSGSIREEF